MSIVFHTFLKIHKSTKKLGSKPVDLKLSHGTFNPSSNINLLGEKKKAKRELQSINQGFWDKLEMFLENLVKIKRARIGMPHITSSFLSNFLPQSDENKRVSNPYSFFSSKSINLVKTWTSNLHVIPKLSQNPFFKPFLVKENSLQTLFFLIFHQIWVNIWCFKFDSSLMWWQFWLSPYLMHEKIGAPFSPFFSY